MAGIGDFTRQITSELLARATQPPVQPTPRPIATLTPETDTGVVGDGITSLSMVTLRVHNPADFVWAETITTSSAGTPGSFDFGIDIPASQGLLHVQLQPGINTFAIYQSKSGVVSESSIVSVYLDPVSSVQQQTLLHKLAVAYLGRPLTPAELQLGTTVLAQTAGDPMPLVEYLSTIPEFIMQFRGLTATQAIDYAYDFLYGRSASLAEKQYWLSEVAKGLNAGIIPWLLVQGATGADAAVLSAKILFAEEATKLHERLMTVMPGELKSERILLETERALLNMVTDRNSMTQVLNSLEVTMSSNPNIIEGGTAALNGDTLSLEFDRPINWQLMDRNGDGLLNVSAPGQGGELQISVGGKKGFALSNAPSNWFVTVPALGSHHLTIANLQWGDTNGGDDATASVLIVGLPDMQDGIQSNVLFKDLS